MDRPLIFMFSGQGSQYFQMGRELFDTEPVFRLWMNRGDEIASRLLGRSVIRELYLAGRKKNEALDEITISHPAIFMVEFALTQLMIQRGWRPDYLLGASLGEIAAACIAGCVSFEQTLTLILKQADRLRSRSGGGMLAVLGPVSLFSDIQALCQRTTLSGVNFDGAFVVSGDAAAIDAAQSELQSRAVMFQRLPVSQAFHSPGIDPLKPYYLDLIRSCTFHPPAIPVVSCARVEILRTLAPEHLWDVIRSPIRFQETIQFLERNGSFNYVDLGPSGTLATFVKYNLAPSSRSKIFPLLTPFGLDRRNLDKFQMEAGNHP